MLGGFSLRESYCEDSVCDNFKSVMVIEEEKRERFLRWGGQFHFLGGVVGGVGGGVGRVEGTCPRYKIYYKYNIVLTSLQHTLFS